MTWPSRHVAVESALAFSLPGSPPLNNTNLCNFWSKARGKVPSDSSQLRTKSELPKTQRKLLSCAFTFLQQTTSRNELNLALDPFWPLLPRTSQQDKQSHPEQYLANIFTVGSQEGLFVQRPPAGLMSSECHGQGKQREPSYKGLVIYRPRAEVHVGSGLDAEASPCF